MLQGTLDDFALADVFRLLSGARKTGRLEVTRQAGAGKVFFSDGDVYYAESSLVREPLGQKLVRSGALTEGQLRRALDEHASTGRRLGQVLLSAGTVSAKELEDAVRTQTEDAVFELLRWERGEFLWEQGEGIDVEIPIAVSVENLIMEASRRLDELDVMRRKIPSAATLVTMAATPPEGAVEINITPGEWRVLVLVNGSRTVGDIASAAGLDEFDATRTLYGLVSAGLLEVISNSAGGSDVDERHSAIRPETESFPESQIEVSSPDHDGTASELLAEPAESAAAPQAPAPVAPLGGLAPAGPETTDAVADEEPVVRLEDLAPDRVDAGEAAPEAWFGDPVAVASETEAAIAPDELAPVDIAPDDLATGDTAPEDISAPEVMGAPEATPVEGVPETEAGEPGDRSVEPSPAPSAGAPTPPLGVEEGAPSQPQPAEEPPAPPAGEPGGSEALPRLDRSAVVRELAGLFSEGEPATPTGAQPPASPPGPDARKRVEDDDQVTKGLISRLIDGVKGL